jgi:hypothetical protein
LVYVGFWDVVKGGFYPRIQGGNVYTGTPLANSVQGTSMAISSDGSVFATGAPTDNTNVGAVWVFVRQSGGGYTQQAKLIGTGNIGASQQGTSVALSADGNTLAVGGPGDNSGHNSIGAVWIFTRTGTVWTQQAKLVGSGVLGAVGPKQGQSVSLSTDGNTVAIGGYLDDNNNGATWIFTRTGGVWAQQSKLVGTGNLYVSAQGFGVSLSGDGNTVAIGGPGDSGGIGAVWIFTRNGTVWTQFGNKITPTGNIGQSQLGTSVSLNINATTFVAGAPNDDGSNGAGFVFVLINGAWTQQQKLVGTDSVDSIQGFSVSISGDGNVFAIGGPQYVDPTFGLLIGVSWVFTRVNNSWIQYARLTANDIDPENDEPALGSSVAISKNGGILAVGGSSYNSTGGTWIYA